MAKTDGKSPKSNQIGNAFYNLEAEQSVLCCALIDDRTIQDIVLDLTSADFYSPANKLIFEAMKQIVASNKALDFVTLTDCLERNSSLSTVGGIDYITTLVTYVPSSANYKYYLDIVKREGVKRKLVQACSDILTNIRPADDTTQLLAESEKLIFDVGEQNKSSDLQPIADSISGFLQRCDEIYKDKNAFHGIMTGFKRLDNITNGFQNGALVVLAARPGVGKSSFALNMAEHAAMNGKVVAIFSLEMPIEQLVQRLMCGLSGVSMKKVLGSEVLMTTDIDKLMSAADVMSKLKIYIDDSSLNTPAKMMSKLRALKMRQGLDMVIVDYLQLMTSDNKRVENRQQDVSNITRNLKIMAKELSVPVIALSQMNRLFERDKDRKPELSDLRESGAIEQDADIVMFLNKVANGTEEEVLPVELIVAKNRNGETAEIPLTWIGKLVRFVDGNNISATIIANKEKSKAKDIQSKSDMADSKQIEDGQTQEDTDATFYNGDDIPLPDAPPPEEEPPIPDFKMPTGLDF